MLTRSQQASCYARPTSLFEALDLLASGAVVPLAGGSDLYPGAGRRLAFPVVDLMSVPELRGIAAGPSLRIGACATWSEIAEAPLPPALAALAEASRQVGGRQIQNVGTLGGNLCTASPAADGAPPLLVVDAEVELAGPGGSRRLPLPAFLTGPRRTARAPGEALVAVHVPAESLRGRSRFLKLGARAHLVISIAMVAVRIAAEGGRVAAAAVAVGSCAPTARRLRAVERALEGAALAEAPGRVRRADVAAGLAPIDDIRASGAYRIDAATALIARAVAELGR